MILTETAWLVESSNDKGCAVWLACVDGIFTYTKNSEEALRFFREADALKVCNRFPNSVATEHTWYSE